MIWKIMGRVRMNANDPVMRLEKILVDDLPEDWDICGAPEEMLLGVPEGTITSLLRQIGENKLWPSLYEVAKRHPEQWMLDLSDFFPHEETFVEPLVHFLLIAQSEHAKVCLAQEADEWVWGQETKHLLPVVIERVGRIRKDVAAGIFQPVVPTLDRVVKKLSELESQFSSSH